MTSPALVKSSEDKMALIVDDNIKLAKKIKKLESTVSHMRMLEMKKSMPPSYLNQAKVKSFSEHLIDENMDLDTWNALVQDNLDRGVSGDNFRQVPMKALKKSFQDAGHYERIRNKIKSNPEFIALQKAQENGDYEEYESMAKSVLGDSSSSGEAGSYQAFLQENLSDRVIRIILENADTQAMECISTAITPSINPEHPRLRSTGSGYGKGTLGFGEGKTPLFGGGQIMDRVAKTLVQRGVRASVTELLIANKRKIVSYDPLNFERELRIIERNLSINHLLIYGDDQINKNGTEVQEMSGILQQLEASTFNASNVHDWDNQAITEANDAPDLFRHAAETLIKVGKIPGGSITGRFSVLLDYGVANQFSRLFDEKQRVNIDNLNVAASRYGQGFSGFVTDLGIFNFKRTRTLELVNGNHWTPAGEESKQAITWPSPAVTAVVTVGGGAVGGVTKFLPVAGIGDYKYYVTAVNDHGESDVSAVVTHTAAVPAGTSKMVISIPYDAVFAGGLVGGETISPCRYFIIYRANAGETDTTLMKPIAKVPINGVSTTTYDDFNQRIPGTTDMFFISHDPLDVAHTSLIPPKEIPIFDPALATSHIWSIYDIGNTTVWAPERLYCIRNVPSSVPAP